MIKLFSKDSKGKVRVWEGWVEGDKVVIQHGVKDGKLQRKETICKAKNLGKTNETTPEEQASLELEAKAIKQKKKGYYETIEAALNSQERTPMTLQNFNGQSHRIEFPCVLQTKFNGLRMMSPELGVYLSKSGEDYSQYVPEKMRQEIESLDIPVDGEIYADDLPLQAINSAFRKNNENTAKLKYVIYDFPIDDMTFNLRYENMVNREELVSKSETLIIHAGEVVKSHEEADFIFSGVIAQGGEGVVYRNMNGVYTYGKRSYDCIKRKNRQAVEAFVLDAIEDKNNQAVLSCQLENGKTFECLMLKASCEGFNARLYSNKDKVVGRYIEVEYEEYSSGGIPTKPVGKRIRDVVVKDGKWYSDN